MLWPQTSMKIFTWKKKLKQIEVHKKHNVDTVKPFMQDEIEVIIKSMKKEKTPGHG